MTLDYKRNNGRCLCLDILNEGEEIKIHRSARKASIRFLFPRTKCRRVSYPVPPFSTSIDYKMRRNVK